MDVFDLRNEIVDTYGNYVRSFFSIREPSTRQYVDALDGSTGGRDPAPAFAPLRAQARDLGCASLSEADRILAWLCRPWKDLATRIEWNTRYKAIRIGRVPYEAMKSGWDE